MPQLVIVAPVLSELKEMVVVGNEGESVEILLRRCFSLVAQAAYLWGANRGEIKLDASKSVVQLAYLIDGDNTTVPIEEYTLQQITPTALG